MTLDEIKVFASNKKGCDSFMTYLSNASDGALIRGVRYHLNDHGAEMHDYVTGEVRMLYSGQQYTENNVRMNARNSERATYFRAYRMMLDRHNHRVWTCINKGRL